MSEVELSVDLQSTEHGGRYVIVVDNGPEAEMTYRKVDENTINIDRTYVPDQYRGRGIAKLLFDRAIEDAKSNGTKIVPQCSYVAVQFRRHPELSDLLAT